jgi:glycogen debranching enzyme
VTDLQPEIDILTEIINATMWDDVTGFYYDRRADGSLSNVKTIGAYWALLAGIVPPDRLDRFVAHLNNPSEFNRPHRVPTLSADHPFYHPLGEYWRGGVWAPTNYMVLRGLTQTGYHDLAHEIGCNHHANVIKVFEQTGTVWENYAPESATQGNIAKGDFVGWSGLPPVAVLFEYVFGLRPDVLNNKLIWDVRLTGAHGVTQYPFGENDLLDLRSEARSSAREKPVIQARSNLPITLEIIWESGTETRQL